MRSGAGAAPGASARRSEAPPLFPSLPLHAPRKRLPIRSPTWLDRCRRARRAETRCASSDTLNYNARACIGDDAKWLDRACLYAYLDAAVGSTTNSAKLVERVLPLQEKLLDVFVRCTKISDAVRRRSRGS